MDEIGWSTVELNILLNSCLLCLCVIAFTSSVKKSESKTHSPETEKFNKWPVNVEHHSTNEGCTNILIPLRIEVLDTSINKWSKERWLLRQVTVYKEKEDTSVEELHDEDSIYNELSLFWLSIFSNVGNQLNDEESQHVVDNNDWVWSCLVPEKTCELISNKLLANLVIFSRDEVSST